MTEETNNIEPEQQMPLELLPAPMLSYQAHAFTSFTELTEAPLGQTVAQMVASLNFPAEYSGYVHVWINDLPLDEDMWEHVIPSEGQMVYVRVIPQGGGGGKDILRVVAMIAIAVVAVYAAPFIAGTGALGASMAGMTLGAQLGTAFVAAGLTIIGNMALNAIIPPPKLELDSGNGLGSQKNQLTGSSNRFAPYAPIPRIFGTRRVYPLLAGRPYTENQGDDEYLRMALLVGWGPLAISDIRIGETPLASFSDVEVEVREGWSNDAALTLYTSTIIETGYSILLSPATAGPSYTYTTRTTETNVTEISVDITAPSGVAKFESDGKRTSIDVDVQVQYAPTGTTNWVTPTWVNNTETGLDQNGRIRISGADTATIRRTGRWKVAAGQYDVRIYRSTTQYDPTKHVQDVRFTTMRSIKASYPVQQSGVALIAIRMKATGQLNGVPQQISCIASSYLPVYSGGTWSYQLSRNPAWAFADVLRRRGGATYLSDNRIDLTSISAWAAACDETAPNASEPRWTFDGVIEGGTVFQVLRQIASTSRANYIVRDGLHSVVRDISQTVPSQHITPRNSFGYTGSKVFLDYPHALRVVFVNAAKNYEEDERIVYDDGYNAGNATKFETLELFGCTSATQAYREGRYYIAAARLRPEIHTVSMDIENLRCTIGDLVRFQHDVVSIGIAAARVISASGTTIVLDQEMTCASGTTYGMRVRKSDGDYVIVTLVQPGTAVTATFQVSSSLAGIAPGDLAMFGVMSTVTVPMLVKKIEPGPEFTAKLHLVDAQAGVYTADTGTIPAFNSNITVTYAPTEQQPDAPTIYLVRSGGSVALLLPDGTLQIRMAVTLTPPASSVVPIDTFDVQWKSSVEDSYIEERYARGTPIYLSPVQEGVTYQIRARSVSSYGIAGPWSAVTTHTVVGKEDAPSNVAGLTAAIKPTTVEIKWTASTDTDYSYTELRLGSSWSTATFLWSGSASSATWPRPANATYTVLAKHYDTSGNESASAASVAVTVTNAIDAPQTIFLTIYRRSPAASTPALPSVAATYDFSTNTLSGLNNSWQVTAPAGTDPLWISTATTTGNTTDTIAATEWSAATILLQDGSSPTVYAVSGSVGVVAVSIGGTYTPSTVTFSATKTVGNGTPTAYAGRFIVATTTDGSSYTNRYTSAADESSYAYSVLTGIKAMRVRLYAAGGTATLLDEEIIPIVSDGLNGADAIVIDLSNDSVTVSAATDGTVTSGLPATTTVKVYKGGVDDTANWTLAKSDSNTTSTLTAGVVSVTALSADTGAVTITATRTGYATQTIVFTLAKARAGTTGYNSAVVELFQRSTTNSAPAVATTGSATYTFASSTISGQPASWTLAVPAISNGGYLWVIRATAYSNTSTDTIANTEWTAPTLIVQNGSDGTPGSPGAPGAPATNSATVALYQWSATQPGNPSGESTYTWGTGAHTAYSGGNSWQATVPANPGTAGVRLWLATKAITATAGTTSTTVSWASGYTVVAWAANGNNGSDGGPGSPGANGLQAAQPTVYQWALSIPSITGAATYTWSSGAISYVPTGWSLTPGTSPSAGYTLWGATVQVTDSAVNLGTNFNWGTASITARGYAGTNGSNGGPGSPGSPGAQGASSRTCYSRIASNPTPVSGTITVTGDARPTSTQSNATWGLNVSWTATDPNPSSTNTLYQADGIYDPSTGNTVWSTPYIASLKVGSLSAITVNTGDLTVNGTLTMASTGYVQSSNWASGSTGWQIGPTAAEFNNVTIRGTMAAGKIQIGSASATIDFVDPAQATVPLPSGAIGFVAYTGDSGTTTYVSQTCTDPKTNNTYDCSYYVVAGAPVTSAELLFTTNSTTTPVARRIRSGAVRWMITAAATVDHWFSLWYRIRYTNGTYSSWVWLATAQEPQNSYGSVAINASGTTSNIALGEGIQFGFSATDSGGNFWNSGNREIRYGTMSVVMFNF